MGQGASQGNLNLLLNLKRLLFRPTWSFFNFPIPEKPHACWKDGNLRELSPGMMARLQATSWSLATLVTLVTLMF